jgi:hypothetical protein
MKFAELIKCLGNPEEITLLDDSKITCVLSLGEGRQSKADCQDETAPMEALAYRELARAVESSGRILVRNCGKGNGIIAWRRPGNDQPCWVKLHCYGRKR